jgi:hypothetical protein
LGATWSSFHATTEVKSALKAQVKLVKGATAAMREAEGGRRSIGAQQSTFVSAKKPDVNAMSTFVP